MRSMAALYVFIVCISRSCFTGPDLKHLRLYILGKMVLEGCSVNDVEFKQSPYFWKLATIDGFRTPVRVLQWSDVEMTCRALPSQNNQMCLQLLFSPSLRPESESKRKRVHCVTTTLPLNMWKHVCIHKSGSNSALDIFIDAWFSCNQLGELEKNIPREAIALVEKRRGGVLDYHETKSLTTHLMTKGWLPPCYDVGNKKEWWDKWEKSACEAFEYARRGGIEMEQADAWNYMVCTHKACVE